MMIPHIDGFNTSPVPFIIHIFDGSFFTINSLLVFSLVSLNISLLKDRHSIVHPQVLLNLVRSLQEISANLLYDRDDHFVYILNPTDFEFQLLLDRVLLNLLSLC